MTEIARFFSEAGFRLAEPWALAILGATIVASAAVGAMGIVRRRAALRSFGPLGRRMAPGASPARHAARLALTCTGLLLLAVGAARPQGGVRSEEVARPGLDLAVVLDASRSMLAPDVAPDRLTRAKREVSELLRRLPGARVAVVVFAGSAHVQVPLTEDTATVELLLSAVEPSAIPLQGTDVGAALGAAARALEPASDGAGGRVALLVGDGEDHGAGAAEAAERLALAGIPLFTASIGTDEGAPIPTGDGGLLRDRRGEVVVTRAREDALVELAARGGGRHFRLGEEGAVARLAAALSRAGGTAARVAPIRSWEERFDRWALPGLALLALGWALPEASRRRRAVPRAAGAVALLCAAALLAGAAPFLEEHERLAEANALAPREPAAALRLYDEVERELGRRAEIDVNRGLALYRAGRVEEARRFFSLARRARGPLASRAAYADGVAAWSQSDEPAAMAAWRRALLLDPRNEAARWNLEIALRAGEPPRGEPSGTQGPGSDPSAPRPPPTGEQRSGEPPGTESPGTDPSAKETPPTGEQRSGEPSGADATGTDPSAKETPPAGEPLSGEPPGTEAERQDPNSPPMPLSTALRLLDSAAARERVMPVLPPRTREPPEKPW